MKTLILDKLKGYVKKKKRIELLTIQEWAAGGTEYKVFAKVIQELEQEGILIAVKSQQTNGKTPALFNVYTIAKEKLKADFISELYAFQRQAVPELMLNSYLTADEKEWQRDFSAIKKLDNYIKKQGFPVEEATLAERSYKLMGDEKWLEQKGGKVLLERLGLWEQMKVVSNPDPLMLAVNRKAMETCSKKQIPHKHLIVENKSIFYLLKSCLKETSFSSLIYGCGWKITAGFKQAGWQLDIEDEESEFYYFGDLDYEGITIYEYIADEVKLAKPFYEALLKKQASRGKEGQRKRPEILAWFSNQFEEKAQKQIQSLLESGCYYPQEALTKEECLECLKKYS